MAGIHVLCSSALLLVACATVHPPNAGSDIGSDPSTPSPSSSAPDASAREAVPSAAPELPIAPTGASPSSSPPVSAPSAALPPGVPATLEFGKVKFEGGEVPKAEASVKKLQKAFTACVNDGGGVRGDGARGSMSFLVRAGGIAEGVSLAADGLEESVRRCLQKAADKKRIGDPSSDPVGVTVELIFTPKRP